MRPALVLCLACFASCGGSTPSFLPQDLAPTSDDGPQGPDLAGRADLPPPSPDLAVPPSPDLAVPPPDLAVPPADLAVPPPPPDLAMPPVADFAKPPPPADLAQPPPADLAQPPPADLAKPPGPDLAAPRDLLSPGPTCNDKKWNGNESWIDCGGGTCPRCANGDHCYVDADCVSDFCNANVCTPLPSCTDKKKNGLETDVDCGGPACPKCTAQKKCALDRDCTSGICSFGVCKGGGTLVGSFLVYDGPLAANDPLPVSCTTQCARLFGGVALDYACSTSNAKITATAYVDCLKDAANCTSAVADDYAKGNNYQCGLIRCACSAWVKDHLECRAARNYCFRD